MDYIIEGTISELTVEGKSCVFKLNGSEAYSVKHGKEKYNILYTKEIKNISEEKYIPCQIILDSKEFLYTKSPSNSLVIALTNEKRIRVSGKIQEDILKDNTKLPVSSITLLAN